MLAQMPIPVPVDSTGQGGYVTLNEIIIFCCIMLLLLALVWKGLDYLWHKDFYSMNIFKDLAKDKENLTWKMNKYGDLLTTYKGNKIKLKESFIDIEQASYMMGMNNRGLTKFYRKFKNNHYDNKED